MIEVNKIYNEPNLDTMARMPDCFCDLIVTDPPYGYSFMNRDWDKAVPSVEIWKECLRVLKPGAFAFIMCAPRQDVLSQMIVNLTQAGFRTDFTSLYHCFASGFPKAGNVSKLVDKKLGAEREVVGYNKLPSGRHRGTVADYSPKNSDDYIPPITKPASDEAKKLAGSFTGFNPKPACEVVLVVMKPLETKTFTEQAMKNGKGCTWLDACRIPHNDPLKETTRQERNPDSAFQGMKSENTNIASASPAGRFCSNLLVSDDALNDGNVYESGFAEVGDGGKGDSNFIPNSKVYSCYNDSGSFSRYFSLDQWWSERLKNFPKSVLQTFPFLIEPKASKSEKNFGLSGLPVKEKESMNSYGDQSDFDCPDGSKRVGNKGTSKQANNHPTVKPVKLLSYLITLGSREGEIVYDPFAGSCTTGVAAEMLNRKWILSEMDKDSCVIGEKRLYPFKIVQKLF